MEQSSDLFCINTLKNTVFVIDGLYTCYSIVLAIASRCGYSWRSKKLAELKRWPIIVSEDNCSVYSVELLHTDNF